MFRSRFLVLGMFLPVLPSPAAFAAEGVFEGVVRVTGELPEPRRFDLDEAMARVHGGKIYTDESWLVGKDRGLAHCVVLLRAKEPAKRVKPEPLANALFEKVGARFTPRVLVVTPGTRVVLRNRNSPCKGFLGKGIGDSFSFLIEAGKEQEYQFRVPGVCPITCGVRPYMDGAVYVADTPFYAVTDQDGRFRISNVPAGDYQITVWHLRAGKINAENGPKETTVPSESPGKLEFTTPAPKSEGK